MNLVDHLQHVLTVSSYSNIFTAILLVYLGGVLTSLTPCIFPMIPITFAVISSVNTSGKKLGSLGVVLTYGMGISLAYASIGVIAVITGGIFGSLFQSPWVKILIANVFLIIAFNAAGWIRLPQFTFQHRSVNSLFSVLVLGFISGFTLSPCTLPILSVVLAYAAGKSILVGGLLLWVYSWGFFTLLLLLGLFGNGFRNVLPKSGTWLRAIEIALFIVCVGVAEYFLLQAGAIW